jgi:hypothetical protein
LLKPDVFNSWWQQSDVLSSDCLHSLRACLRESAAVSSGVAASEKNFKLVGLWLA